MSRTGIMAGATIDLRVVFTDSNGLPVATDALPDIYIYTSLTDEETMLAEVEAQTYTSALVTDEVEELAPGFYEYSYTLPSGAVEGVWHDVWVSTIDGVDVVSIKSFNVNNTVQVVLQTLHNNQLIVIELDKSISNEDNTKTLGEDQVFTFSTQFLPFYTNVTSLRMEAGPLVSFLPDSALALMIYWSSLEADFISPPVICDMQAFCFAKAKFVTYDAALRAMLSPGASFVNGMHSSSGGIKRLGELMISDGRSANSGSLSGGLDKDTFKHFKDLRDEWLRVVNAGACIVPGQGLAPTSAIRGLYDPARRPAGRLWEDPKYYPYTVPAINTRSFRTDQRHKRGGFAELLRGSRY